MDRVDSCGSAVYSIITRTNAPASIWSNRVDAGLRKTPGGDVKVTGSYGLPVSPDRAYELLQDADVLATCLPGCEGLDRTGDGEYAMRIGIGMAGVVRISERNPPESFRLSVEASGKVGFLKGEGVITLVASSGASVVQFEGDVQVGGAVAVVGQRLIESTAKMIVERFLDCLGQLADGAL